MQSKHYNFTSFLISFNSEATHIKPFSALIVPTLLFFFTSLFFYFPLSIFYIQGPCLILNKVDTKSLKNYGETTARK